MATTQANTRYCGWEGYEYRPQILLENALKDDPLNEEMEEKWGDAHEAGWGGSPRPAARDSGMDVVYQETLFPPHTPTTY